MNKFLYIKINIKIKFLYIKITKKYRNKNFIVKVFIFKKHQV